MDGFSKRDRVFVLGSTNDAENLDKAALRPGRFDKHIYVPLPDLDGRKEIFKHFLNKITLKLDADVQPEFLGKLTGGFSGAEIENLVNLATIEAVDKNDNVLTRATMEEARDRVLMGIKKRNKQQINQSMVHSAVKEASKALVCLANADCREKFHKLSITERSKSKGNMTVLDENEEGTRGYLKSLIDMQLAGPIGEQMFFGSAGITSENESSLPRATDLAKRMVTKFGMEVEDYGLMVIEDGNEKEHKESEWTRTQVDNQVDRILSNRANLVRTELEGKEAEVKVLAQKLIEYEQLTKTDVEAILKDLNVDYKPAKEKKRDADFGFGTN